jgi:hypothetical protein
VLESQHVRSACTRCQAGTWDRCVTSTVIASDRYVTVNKNCRHEDGGLHYIKHYYCSWFPAPLTVALGVLYFGALLTILYEATEFFFVPSLQLVSSPRLNQPPPPRTAARCSFADLSCSIEEACHLQISSSC